MKWFITIPRPANPALASFPKLLEVEEARGWTRDRFRKIEQIQHNIWETTIEAPDELDREDLRAQISFSDVHGDNGERHWLTLEPA